jgi:nicotinamide mononucleotide (NMN) deamidase PncC
MSEPSISVQWATADLKRSDHGYRISLDLALASSVDQQHMHDMQRGLSARLASTLGVQITGVVFGLKERGPSGDLVGLAFVAPASVFDIAPSAFRRAVTDALNQSMEAASQQRVEDDAARTGWLAAVRDAG